MHWSVLTRYLMALLVISCTNEINGETRPKRDLQLITDILRMKLDSIKNLSNIVNFEPLPQVVINKPTLKPDIVETHTQIGLQVIVPPTEVTAEEPCDIKPIQATQEIKPLPYAGNYYYKQIRDDGTSLIYKSNENGEVDVTDTRYTVPEEELKPMPYETKFLYTQIQNEGDSSGVIYTLDNRGQVQISNIKNKPLKTENNFVKKSSLAYQSGIRPIWTPNQSFNGFATPIRPMQVPAIQNSEFTPEYSYKLLHKDGFITSWRGTGDIKEQQLRFPAGANFQKAVPDPPAYLVDRIENVAANALCLNKPSNVLCRLNPIWFRYPFTVRNVQVGVFPGSPVTHVNAYGEQTYDTIPLEVKEVPKGYIYVPPTLGYEVPQPVWTVNQNQASEEEKIAQIVEDDIKLSEKNNDTQTNNGASAPQEGTFMYKQLNADGSAINTHGKGKDNVSVEVNDGGARVYKPGRGDIPEGRSFE